MSKRDEFTKHMEEELAIWSNRLKTLESKGGPARREEHKKQIEEWNTGASVARAKLTELEAAVGDGWDVLKLEMVKIWHDLDGSLSGAEASLDAHLDAERARPAAPAPPVPLPGPGTEMGHIGTFAVRPEAPPVPLPGPGTKTDNIGAPALRPDEQLPAS